MTTANTNQAQSAPDQPTSVSTAEPVRRTSWTLKARITRLVWAFCEILLWRISPPSMAGFRNTLLRLFGAKIGKGVRIHPSVKVVIPWNIEIGDGVTIHERAILYALGKITIGSNSEIGPLVHLCAGTHDHTDPVFPLLREPITISERCSLGAASFVAPGTVLAQGTILHPMGALYSDSTPDTQYRGNPAKPFVPTTDQDSTT